MKSHQQRLLRQRKNQSQKRHKPLRNYLLYAIANVLLLLMNRRYGTSKEENDQIKKEYASFSSCPKICSGYEI